MYEKNVHTIVVVIKKFSFYATEIGTKENYAYNKTFMRIVYKI